MNRSLRHLECHGGHTPGLRDVSRALAQAKVKLFTGCQKIVRLAIVVLAVVNADDAAANHLQQVSAHDDRGRLVDSNTEQLGLLGNHLNKVI